MKQISQKKRRLLILFALLRTSQGETFLFFSQVHQAEIKRPDVPLELTFPSFLCLFRARLREEDPLIFVSETVEISIAIVLLRASLKRIRYFLGRLIWLRR